MQVRFDRSGALDSSDSLLASFTLFHGVLVWLLLHELLVEEAVLSNPVIMLSEVFLLAKQAAEAQCLSLPLDVLEGLGLANGGTTRR